MIFIYSVICELQELRVSNLREYHKAVRMMLAALPEVWEFLQLTVLEFAFS